MTAPAVDSIANKAQRLTEHLVREFVKASIQKEVVIVALINVMAHLSVQTGRPAEARDLVVSGLDDMIAARLKGRG